MNQKELNELRRRFKPDRTAISKVYGCYVSSSRQIISYVDAPLGLLSQEEQEMYLNLLKKTLSGALGRNLIDIVFSTAQVADSDEHRLLQTLRQTELQDANARESLYRRIIDAIDMGESSYLILLAADTYDVPHRSRDDLEVPDASETVFRYFVCAICPVKDPTLTLQYSDRDKEFRGSSTGHIAQPPALGFLFPAFDDRAANIYNALFYSKDTAQLHQEVIDAVFRVQEAPMSPQEQQNLFAAALTETLEKDCSYDVVQAVHEQLRGRIQEHKESRDPEPLTLSVREVGDVLTGGGEGGGLSGPVPQAVRPGRGPEPPEHHRGREVPDHHPGGEDHRAAGVQLYGGGPDHRRAAVHPHPRRRRGGGQRHRRHHPQSPGMTHGPIRIKMRMGRFFVFLSR